jgi:hypothetical protein
LIPLDSELSNRRSDYGFGNRRRARAIVRGHRRVSVLGSVEDESAICSEPIKQKAPAEAGAFDPMNSFGKIQYFATTGPLKR